MVHLVLEPKRGAKGETVARGLYESPCKRVKAVRLFVDGLSPDPEAARQFVELVDATV